MPTLIPDLSGIWNIWYGLPRSEAKARVHPMYYRAIRLATYRPASFFRGFLFPLACSTGNDDEDEFG